MNWDDLKYFLAVARSGQMLGAATRLGVAQATLGRRITALERALDTKLFERSTTGCTLTGDGQRLLEHAMRVEAETLAAARAVQGRESAVSGTVRIGAPDGFGVSFLAPRLHQLSDACPQLTVQLVPVPRAFSLSQREADIAVMVGRPETGRLRARKLTDYTLGLYAAREYLAARPAPHRVEDLRDHRLVGYVEDLIFTEALNYTAQIYRDWQSAIEISSALGQFSAVRAGAGIGVLHDFMAAGTPGLVPVLPELRLTREYWVAWHESMSASRRVSAVARFLDATVKAERGRFAVASG